MTEIDESIIRFELALEKDDPIYINRGDCKRAIAAIRREKERSRGCPQCENSLCMASESKHRCAKNCDECRFNPEGNRFCPHCGRPLTEAESVEVHHG